MESRAIDNTRSIVQNTIELQVISYSEALMQSAVRKEIIVQVEIVVEPDDNGFHAYCPALKGLHVGGDTEEEAIKNAEDAAIAYLESFIKHNDPLPLGIIVKEPKASKEKGKLKHHTVNLAINCS